MIFHLIANNFRRGLKKPNLILPFLFNFFFNKQKKIREQIYNRKIIWHFCTPKSASSYFVYLMKKKKIDNFLPLPHYSKRGQSHDFFFLAKQLKKISFNKKIYLNHTHTLYDDFLNRFISKNHLVVIQSRNIYKSILSLRDFIILNKKYQSNPWLNFNYDKKNFNQKDLLKLIIYNYTPFHVNFVKLWFESKIKGKKIFVNYTEFVKKPEKTIDDILKDKKKIKINFDINKRNKKEINFNIGLNRKDTLSKEEKKIIDNIVDINLINTNPKIRKIIYQN
jgi:hypothetical protein